MEDLTLLLKKYKEGKFTEEQVLNELQNTSVEEMGFANIDHHRQQRQGFPEVIYSDGKTSDQILKIAKSIIKRSNLFLATKADRKIYNKLKKELPGIKFDKAARVIYLPRKKYYQEMNDCLLILTAGTSDIPVAEEARLSAEAMGFKAKKIYDVGVSGIHRLFKYKKELEFAKVIIVAAGMEGALPSVVGGLVSVPVIAVPTSIGYGTSFNGITALLAMLNSCANGITVVNIDNGYGAAFAACRILRSHL